jgi:hypothetical protein
MTALCTLIPLTLQITLKTSPSLNGNAPMI